MSKLEPQTPPAESLADLSAPAPPRGEGASDLLGSPGEPLAPWVDPNPAGTEQGAGGGEETADERSTVDDQSASGSGGAGANIDGRRRAARKPRIRTGGNSPSAIYTSIGVQKRFERYRHKTKQTNLQVVLEAVGSKYDDLEEIIAAAKVNTAPVNEMFAENPSAVRYIGGGSVQIMYIPTPAQEAKLDEIGQKLQIDTRSTWLAPVLNAFLPGQKDTRRD